MTTVDTTMAPSSMLEAALAYAAQDFAVFPLPAGEKAAKRSYQDATTDAKTIEHWWTLTPDANIGLYPWSSHCVVVDNRPDAKVGV